MIYCLIIQILVKEDLRDCLDEMSKDKVAFLTSAMKRGDWEQAHSFFEYIMSRYQKPLSARYTFALAYLNIMKMGKLSYERRIR